jgi:hypothetical protein
MALAVRISSSSLFVGWQPCVRLRRWRGLASLLLHDVMDDVVQRAVMMMAMVMMVAMMAVMVTMMVARMPMVMAVLRRSGFDRRGGDGEADDERGRSQ